MKMLQTKYYYETRDLISLDLSLGTSAAAWDSTDVEDFLPFFDKDYATDGNPIYANKAAAVKLMGILCQDNHLVFIADKDYMSHQGLPANYGDVTGIIYFEGESVVDYYRNLYLFLYDTTEKYAKRLSLYAEMIQHYTEKSTSSANAKTGLSDMPITASFDNAPSSDVLSSLSETETETTTEPTTPLERYEAALNSTRSILKEWYDEYIRRFAIYE